VLTPIPTMLFLCEHMEEQVELGISGYQNLSWEKQAIQISGLTLIAAI